MNISFGKIRHVKEIPVVNPTQMWVVKEIEKAFDVSKDKMYAYGADSRGNELTLAQYLERKKGVDVVITAKKGVKVSVSLQKTLYNKEGEKILTYIIGKNSYTPYKMDINPNKLLNPLFDITNMLNKFVKRCLYFANTQNLP